MTNDTRLDNKRIARNTIMLYLRMFITMPIGLYTSRLVLEALGVESYGVYSVIGGVVSLFAILTGALSVSISRYLTYEIGSGDKRRLNTIFCTSLNIQLAMALMIMLLAEVFGVWFLNSYMNIPPDKIVAANWVFQCSIVTFLVGLVSVPYNALIVAHERMSAFAYISIVESTLKFLIALGLFLCISDRLIVYAVLLMCVSIMMRCMYGVYCSKYFEESKYRFILDKSLIKEMSKFIGWAFFGNGVVVLKDQGTNVLLNIFGGPVVNAAQGLAIQVNGVVSMFVNNFLMAVHPQITKSFSAHDLSNMHNLIIRASKMSFFILLLLFVPICLNIDYILGLWLVEVPPFTSNFIILILLFSLIQCFTQPILTGVLAEGNIKRYEINLTILYGLNFIINYILLKIEMPPYYVFVMNIVFGLFVLGILLKQAKDKYQFPVFRFCTHSLGNAFFISVISIGTSYFIRINLVVPFIDFLLTAVLQIIITGMIICLFGLSKRERSFIFSSVLSKLKYESVLTRNQ